MLRLFSLFLLLATQRAIAQDANCDFSSNVVPGQTYNIRNPQWPSNYSGGSQCRWIGICPSGYNCVVNCNTVNLPQSQSCSLDRLLVSRTGDPQLTSADYYCGRGTLTAVSTGQRISVGLISSRNSPGGTFDCQLYARPISTPPTSNCSCGYKKQNRIVGGQETGVNEFPMMAGVVDTRIFEIKCGGVIISNRHVLSAAHCFLELPIASTAVVVGEHDVTTGDSPATQGYSVTNIRSHPQFTTSNYDYDIAILTVANNIQFSGLVGPACLPFKFVNTDMAGTKLTILGWGTIFSGGPTSDVLRKVDVDVMSQGTCQQRVATLTSRQICTFTPGRDACQDDSGGPLLYTDPSTGLLFNMGIVSFGRFCASNEPGVNTRVTTLLSWIVANTPGVDYCRK